MKSRVIDIHPHIISNDTTAYPHSPLGGKQSTWSRERPVTFEQIVQAMDEAGVDKAAIVQSSTCYGYDNSYLVDSIAKLPERVCGVGCVDVTAADAPAVIANLASRGIQGLRLFTGGSTIQVNVDWLDDPVTYPAWEAAGEHGMAISIQTRPVGLPKAGSLARRFPKVKVVIDHLARAPVVDGPPYKEAEVLFVLADLPNVYLKVTPRTFDQVLEGKASAETYFPRLVSVFGAERMAFGSNYPSSEGDLPGIVARAKSVLSCLPDEQRHMVLAGTAQILYPALADEEVAP
ncbi:amidohydrolase family protein [Chelativorans salis]|uniref:Amidohydrolase n=1 Tax=Chelativorans salis TaxID=2978478 RepID=A0ABT2LTS7_9HYPH|nr:amidohydrolase family protein [Chelativorans sp. EGI FJ00035]MCT7376773.1 amidohydrolase [Chelativorans sp. EGI FJ00035]